MKRSARPPDYLIEAIARHAEVLVKMRPTNTREAAEKVAEQVRRIFKESKAE